MPTVNIPSDKRWDSVDITTTKTLSAADQGIVQNVRSNSTITLPATANGLTFIIRNGGAVIPNGPTGTSGAAITVTLAPNAADAIAGIGFTPAVNKAAINTLGQVGDYLVISGTGSTGAGAWNIVEKAGTWTRQA